MTKYSFIMIWYVRLKDGIEMNVTNIRLTNQLTKPAHVTFDHHATIEFQMAFNVNVNFIELLYFDVNN